MNKGLKKFFIVFSCICIAVIIAGVGVILYIENGVKNKDPRFISLAIERAESAYNKDKNADNLIALCDTLCFSGDDEKIVEYFPQFLFDEEIVAKIKSEDDKKIYDGFLSSYFISIYRAKGADALYAELEKHIQSYYDQTQKYIYINLTIVNEIFPQRSEDLIGIYQVFVKYAEDQGIQEEIELAHSEYETAQQYVDEHTLSDGTLAAA